MITITATLCLNNTKIKKIIRIEKDKNCILQLIPDYSVTNGKNVEILVNALHEIQPSFIDKFSIENKTLIYRYNDLPSFEILFTKNSIKFFLVVPDKWKDFIINKIQVVWPNVAVKETEDYSKLFKPNQTKIYNLGQKYHYFMSIRADYRENAPLENMLSTANYVHEDDAVLFQIILQPIQDYWKIKADEYWKKYRQGKEVVNKSLIIKILDILFIDLLNAILEFIDLLLGIIKSKKQEQLTRTKQLSSYTNNKTGYKGFNVSIRVFSYSKNSIRRTQNAKSIYLSLRDIAGDNEIELKNTQIMKDAMFIRKRNRLKAIFEKNILSTKEVSQLLQLPTRELQIEYNIKDSIDTREINIPHQLLQGNITIGEVSYKGNKANSYWPNNKNILSLPKIVVGPMGSGKSEYSKNFVVNAAKKGDSVIVFDYIKNCELSNDISKHIDCIKLDLSKINNLFSLSYPEIKITDDPWQRLNAANMLSRQVEYLINSLSDEPLTSRMIRYLDAASKVVFIHENAKVGDVIDVLTNWKIRNEYIRKAKYSGIFNDDDIEILDLESLHDRDKEGRIVGTKDAKIEGVIDRINIMMKDIYLRAMLKAEVNYNYNFVKWINEGKVILIQLPEHTFINKQIKDTVVTYFMSRVWLAALQRKNCEKLCHVITDEIHQVPTAAKLVSHIITEARKFGVDFYFTIHYLKQFRALHDAIRSAGASYMFLAGTEKENFIALEEELKPFTIEEGLNLKPFHSLNIINYGNQYARFISRLPKPIK